MIEYKQKSFQMQASLSVYASGSWTILWYLTHWGRVMHICVGKLTTIGSDNGFSPDRRQAIIWTYDGILLIGRLGTTLSEISIVIHIFSFKKMHLNMSSGKWRPCCLGLNVLKSMQQLGIPQHILHLTLQWRHMSVTTFQIIGNYNP